MTNLSSFIKSKSCAKTDVYSPEFFRLGDPRDREEFCRILSDTPGIQVYDEIEGQLKELVRLQNPSKKYSPQELTQAALDHTGSTPLEEYGVWVYYPWNNKMVHLLDEDEFVESRTNRNMYKISPQERDILATKKVGVVGLSVGSSIAYNLAQERLCGELRLVDFDKLDLTNLNRIADCVSSVGTYKTTSIARRIAELDPFLSVKVWSEPASSSNLDQFLGTHSPIDLVFDECDSIDVKFLLRDRAKQKRIPVLMSTSDRGMFDVERFDLNPTREIFHGLVGDVDYSKLANLKTSEEKLPYVLPILGIDAMSKRLKGSMVEIGASIPTWPQLASDVNTGAGMSGFVAKSIMLDQKVDSGRYFFDVQETFDAEKDKKVVFQNPNKKLTFQRAEELVNMCAPIRRQDSIELQEDVVKDLVQAAITAPSGGNCQPWMWVYKNTNLILLHDKFESYSLLDVEDSGSHLAFGAAIENIELQAAKYGLDMSCRLFPHGEKHEVIAILAFSKAVKVNESALAEYIFQRHTNRNLIQTVDFSQSTKEKLQMLDSQVKVVYDSEVTQRIGRQFAIGERIRILNPRGNFDFANEIRWSLEEVERLRNGIDLRTIDLSESDKVGLKVISDNSILSEINSFGENVGGKLEEMSLKAFQHSQGLALITKLPEESYIDAGRRMQKFWLELTKLEVSVQPVSAPLFLHRRSVLDPNAFGAKESEELKEVYSTVLDAFNLEDWEQPIFLIRLSNAEGPTKSNRKHVKDVFLNLKTQAKVGQ